MITTNFIMVVMAALILDLQLRVWNQRRWLLKIERKFDEKDERTDAILLLLNRANMLNEKMFDCEKNTEYNLPPDYDDDDWQPTPYNERIFHIGNIYRVNADNRIKILKKANEYIVVKNIDTGDVNICDQWYDRENKCCWLNYFPLGKNVNCRTDVLGENYYKFNKYIFENEEK